MRRVILIALTVLMASPAFGQSKAYKACRPPAGHGEPAPIVAIQGPAHHGTDRAIEPFSLLQMEAAAAWRGRQDESAANRGVEALVHWARAGALREVVDAGPAGSNTNSIYSLRRALIAILGSWMELRTSPAGRIHHAEIERWLGDLVALQDVPTGGEKSRAKAEAVSNHNNHALLRATVAAQWATLTGSRELADKAAQTAVATIDGMRADGGLPLEMARGSRALWYQRHAIASLVYLADLLQPFGQDLWLPRVDGVDLHRAIAFLLNGIEQPERLSAVTGGEVGSSQDFSFLVRRGNGRHYMAWAELYRARFPERDESRRLGALLPQISEPGWPLLDDYVGGNTTCRVLSSDPA